MKQFLENFGRIKVSGPRAATVASLLTLSFLAGCGSAPKTPETTDRVKAASQPKAKSSKSTPSLPKANSGRGGYYKDDGPGEDPPPDLESTVDPIPRNEPVSSAGNRPYKIFGKTYTPITDTDIPFKQTGTATWYGKKFHGQKTSSGELYDMYKITAAHPTLPIPSYARVTNLENGKQIIVRVNDRGPFHSTRIIDLSYTAALKLGYVDSGSGQMEVERLLPADIEKMAENRNNQPVGPGSETLATLVQNHRNAATASPVPATAPGSRNEKMSLDELLSSQDNQSVEKMDASAAAPPGFYIQFGAYAIRANAEAILDRLKGRLLNRLPDFNIVEQGSLYRLISGPFSSRNEASAAIARSGDLGVSKPLVVER
jgi:rare lipoprotein A